MAKFNINSVSTPSLHFDKKKEQNFKFENSFSQMIEEIISNNHIDITERLMIELMFRNGMRVSELLKLKGSDLMDNGTFIIRASKGSNNRIGFIITHKDLLYCFKGLDYPIFSCYSRQFIYYRFKRLGINIAVFGNHNKAVTHAMRHNLIENMESKYQTSDEIKEAIGHKSVKSTEHYLNHKLKK